VAMEREGDTTVQERLEMMVKGCDIALSRFDYPWSFDEDEEDVVEMVDLETARETEELRGVVEEAREDRRVGRRGIRERVGRWVDGGELDGSLREGQRSGGYTLLDEDGIGGEGTLEDFGMGEDLREEVTVGYGPDEDYSMGEGPGGDPDPATRSPTPRNSEKQECEYCPLLPANNSKCELEH